MEIHLYYFEWLMGSGQFFNNYDTTSGRRLCTNYEYLKMYHNLLKRKLIIYNLSQLRIKSYDLPAFINYAT